MATDSTARKMALSQSGGGGGTSDYIDLTNKPKINNVTLTGNKTSADLGIIIPTLVSELTNDSVFITNNVANLTNYYSKTQTDALLSTKVDKITGKGLSTNDFTDTLKTGYDGAVTDRHTHANKTTLDAITSTKVTAWDAKPTTEQMKTEIDNSAYTLPDATTSVKGGIIVGSGLSVSNGIVSVKDNQVIITDNSATVSLTLLAGYEYYLTNAVSSLTITLPDTYTMMDEFYIMFKTSSTITSIDVPVAVAYTASSSSTFEASKQYEISIKGNWAVCPSGTALS